MSCTSLTVLVPVPKLMGERESESAERRKTLATKSAGSHQTNGFSPFSPFLSTSAGNSRGPAPEPCGLIKHQTVVEPPDANWRWQTLGYGVRLQPEFNSAVNKIDHYFAHQNWLTVIHFLFASLHPPLLPISTPPLPTCSIIPASCFPLIFPLSRHHTGELSLFLLPLPCFGVLTCADLWALDHSWHVRHGRKGQLDFTCN